MRTSKTMKMVAFSMLVALMSATALKAQTKGDNVVGFGIGFGGTIYSGYYGSGISRIPTLSVNYEHFIVDNLWDENSSIGVGGILGYASASTDYWKSSNIIIGGRGALHYQFTDKLDAYTGLMLGYDVASFKWKGFDYGSSSAGGFTYSWFLGGRYYFSDTFAAFAELGYGIAVFNVGVAMKF